MTLNITQNEVVVFDLDDTIYKEVEYLKSAYRFISAKIEKQIQKNIYDEMFSLWVSGQSVFDVIKSKYSFIESIDDLVFYYRYHIPKIVSMKGVEEILDNLFKSKIKLAIITDGRSITQRNKIKALGIEKYFETIIISEEIGSTKPDPQNFKVIMQKFPDKDFIYIADNFNKDFISPNKLGWKTIALLDDGTNIHKQDLSLPDEYHPKMCIRNFNELQLSIKL